MICLQLFHIGSAPTLIRTRRFYKVYIANIKAIPCLFWISNLSEVDVCMARWRIQTLTFSHKILCGSLSYHTVIKRRELKVSTLVFCFYPNGLDTYLINNFKWHCFDCVVITTTWKTKSCKNDELENKINTVKSDAFFFLPLIWVIFMENTSCLAKLTKSIT